MSISYRLAVAREQYKFSCAHMTVFPDGSKERLHGHNYTVSVALELADVSFANMVAFAEIKTELAQLCLACKERVLVATANPFFEALTTDANAADYEFRLCGQRYLLPRSDVLALPIDNIAVEPLAAYLLDTLRLKLAAVLARPHVRGLEVTVEESPGQGATARFSKV